MIQWYPGHMAKAKKEIQENLRFVDIVFELVDARIPLSSRNPMIHEVLQSKPKIVLMTKADMADSQANKRWISYFTGQNEPVLLIDSISGFQLNKIATLSKEILREKLERERVKGMKERSIRCMIVGIPNVGKSTLINRLVKKKATMVGNKPGVTKAQQWVRINKQLELLDTPGVLWPKFEDVQIGMHLALTGAIKDHLLPMDQIGCYLLKFLQVHYPNQLLGKYNIEAMDVETDALQKIATARGFTQQGAQNSDRIYESLIYDFRSNRLGKITLDQIPAIGDER